jgi:GLPGLI family protein
MKTQGILLIGVMVSILAWAQIREGVIEYELRMDMHRNIPAEREEMKKMIPQYRTQQFQLFFNDQASHFKPIEEDEDLEVSGGGRTMRFRMPQIETYIDLMTKLVIQDQEFMGKQYLIHDTLTMIPWKIGTHRLEIAGYDCQMAYYHDEEKKQEITAWFTSQIQPFVGPDRYTNLPGTVLAVDINNGERTWVARKVQFKALKKNDIKKPAKGEVITQNDYRKMVEEQMEKMRQQGGGMMRFGG